MSCFTLSSMLFYIEVMYILYVIWSSDNSTCNFQYQKIWTHLTEHTWYCRFDSDVLVFTSLSLHWRSTLFSLKPAGLSRVGNYFALLTSGILRHLWQLIHCDVRLCSSSQIYFFYFAWFLLNKNWKLITTTEAKRSILMCNNNYASHMQLNVLLQML